MDCLPRLRVVLGLALCLLPFAFAQAGECLKYQPEPASLSGQLVRKAFAGPPNFEDVATGDEPLIGYYLKLAEPLCMTGNADEEDVDLDADVRLVQLVLDQKGYDMLRPYLGQKVELKGTMFGAVSGYHNTPVLLQQVEKVSGQPAPAPDCAALDKTFSAVVDGSYDPPLTASISGKERAYFFTAPNFACTNKKIFVVPGDKIEVSQISENGWTKATYTAKDGKTSSGWIDQGQVQLDAVEPEGGEGEEALPDDVDTYTVVRHECVELNIDKSCAGLKKKWDALMEEYKGTQEIIDVLNENKPPATK